MYFPFSCYHESKKGDLYGAEDYGGTKADATGSGGRIAPGA